MIYTADFETTVDPQDCRVWAWGVCEVDDPSYFQFGNSIEGMLDFMRNSDNSEFWFHNLKFDSAFIIDHLFRKGFKHVEDRRDAESKTFTTLISNMGAFYSMTIYFEKKGKKTVKATIYDSLKVLPYSVDEVAKGFNLPIHKLKIDYKKYRPKGHILTPDEIMYLKNDVEIMARALNILFSQDLCKMTQASNAKYDYVKTVGESNFNSWFPTLLQDVDEKIRKSYKGGFTYLAPEYKEEDIGEGFVIDINSLYPWTMRECLLPFDKPYVFTGRYEPREECPLYVQKLRCQFELKEGYIPTLQIKKDPRFVSTHYLTTSDGEFVNLTLTNVDLELFLDHYNIYNEEWHGGWMFRGSTDLFKPYIDKWMKIKVESTINKNKAMRSLSKLMLNALYGKFGLNPHVASKVPYIDPEDDTVHFRTTEETVRDGLYIPVATFRYKLRKK